MSLYLLKVEKLRILVSHFTCCIQTFVLSMESVEQSKEVINSP